MRGKHFSATPGRCGATDSTSRYGSRSARLRAAIARTVKRSRRGHDLREVRAARGSE